MNKDVKNLLGLAQRAGQLAFGEGVVKAIRQKKAFLVLYASDASENTKKLIANKASFYEVPAIEIGQSDELSEAVGKNGRMSVAILSNGFAKKIKEKLGVGEKYGKDE